MSRFDFLAEQAVPPHREEILRAARVSVQPDQHADLPEPGVADHHVVAVRPDPQFPGRTQRPDSWRSSTSKPGGPLVSVRGCRRPSLLRPRRRVCHDIRIHRELLVIAPLDFLLLRDPLQQPHPPAARSERRRLGSQSSAFTSVCSKISLAPGLRRARNSPQEIVSGGFGFHFRPLISRLVDPHAAAQFQQHLRVAALGLSAGPRRAGYHPHRPPIHRGLALQSQVEQIGYFRKEGKLPLALLFRLVHDGAVFPRAFPYSACPSPDRASSARCAARSGLSGLPSRSSVRRCGCPSRISVSHFSLFRGLYFAVGIEVPLHGVRLPGVVLHADPVELVLCNGTADQLARDPAPKLPLRR